ncbi:MAG: hypothetical protein JXA37_11735 [Chloroflexia bacterium]|nr:hypothetical protein [Chloroflexia bacterium]
MSTRVGETIAVSIREFQAQSYDLYEAPAFGSFIHVASTAPGVRIYAVVQDIRTEPIDPSRPVIARGAELDNEQAIYQENPHFRHVMRTRFSAVVVGYLQQETARHMLPPQPPRIHGFVHACTQAEIAAFTQDLGFLRLLLAAQASNDLLSACVRCAAAARSGESGYLLGLGKELMTLLAEDPERLNSLLPLLRG